MSWGAGGRSVDEMLHVAAASDEQRRAETRRAAALTIAGQLGTGACCGTRLTKKASDRNRMHFECWEEHHSDPGGSWPPSHRCQMPRSEG